MILYIRAYPKIRQKYSFCYFNQNVPCYFKHNKNKNKAAITKISDELWDRISTLLPTEKPNSTFGRPAIPLEKYSMVLSMFLEPEGVNGGRCYLLSLVLAQPAIADSNNEFE